MIFPVQLIFSSWQLRQRKFKKKKAQKVLLNVSQAHRLKVAAGIQALAKIQI